MLDYGLKREETSPKNIGKAADPEKWHVPINTKRMNRSTGRVLSIFHFLFQYLSDTASSKSWHNRKI